jgi:hypothetical protein
MVNTPDENPIFLRSKIRCGVILTWPVEILTLAENQRMKVLRLTSYPHLGPEMEARFF